jgi:hypothetical protein
VVACKETNPDTGAFPGKPKEEYFIDTAKSSSMDIPFMIESL